MERSAHPSSQPSLKMSPPSRCKFFSLTETPEDYTLMVDEEGFKGGAGLGKAAVLPSRRVLTDAGVQ